MAKKKKNSNHNDNGEVGEKKEEGKNKGGDGGENKKEDKNSDAVVLKIEMHCEGCVSKIVKCARGFDGVESVKADMSSNKLTVTGKVDPLQIRDELHHKTKKKVDLISPQPKKEKQDTTDNNSSKDDKKKPNEKKPDADKKPKEAPVMTAVLKLRLHCQGCIEKIYKLVSKTRGVQEVALDNQKETVTVKGTMDVKALTEALKEKLKRPVEIVPPKKDGNGGDKEGENAPAGGGGGGGKKKKKGGGGGSGEGDGDGGGGGGGEEHGGGDMGVGSRMEYMVQPGFGYMGQPVYGNGYVGQPVLAYGQDYGQGYGYGYGHGYVPGYPVHMKFNDENPNACSIM